MTPSTRRGFNEFGVERGFKFEGGNERLGGCVQRGQNVVVQVRLTRSVRSSSPIRWGLQITKDTLKYQPTFKFICDVSTHPEQVVLVFQNDSLDLGQFFRRQPCVGSECFVSSKW